MGLSPTRATYGERTNRAIGNAWKAFGSLIWMGIETSFLRKMGKINLYLDMNFAEIRFKSHKDCRNFVNRGNMPNILHKNDLEFSRRRMPKIFVGILITKYKKIGSSKIEIEYRYLDQRGFNLEKLLN